jgi:hypothetical protein
MAKNDVIQSLFDSLSATIAHHGTWTDDSLLFDAETATEYLSQKSGKTVVRGMVGEGKNGFLYKNTEEGINRDQYTFSRASVPHFLTFLRFSVYKRDELDRIANEIASDPEFAAGRSYNLSPTSSNVRDLISALKFVGVIERGTSNDESFAMIKNGLGITDETPIAEAIEKVNNKLSEVERAKATLASSLFS